ncbi:aminotransferase class I/II-fold pyridoxal phosphate-dependent enzyme [Acetobacterium fimetarium]|uniref:Aminotransferase class I/II-fold pyridoxal phosphate-dependent enzyme n=1 Tax=Acetobacterium fimetarium TaxID=52691 RepID=A0ABR6WYF2_9FIRM|nr:DegT/DnrJ/EryC1/StrS family aminotransferase [Acetobacterium fimetarium]MBC3805617.1 aminotransferase class I/II-fold pyridoxal phosphate-dependent enzyme [Acetobacterium fimetarium]
MTGRDIKLSPPDITDAEINAVVEVMKSGWITTGPKTKQFERAIAAYCTTNRAVCLNSGTAALELTLRLLEIGPGDEVITTPYTYTASASVIDHVGAKIIMVDTAVDSYEMDYDQLAQAINSKTKAIIPVDIAGVMCDYDKIFEIVQRKKSVFTGKNAMQKAIGRVVIVADAAHSFGATYQGHVCGSVADFTCFSFHAVKNLTTAEGGACTWIDIPGIDNDDIYRRLMLLSLHGQSKDALSKLQLGGWEFDIECTGYKYNMTDIMAAIGLEQLKRYPRLLERRKEITKLYNKLLKDIDVTPVEHLKDDSQSSMHLYLVRIADIDSVQRDAIFYKMAENGIATLVHYKPLPMMTAYQKLGFEIKNFPNAYNVYRNEISLPLHTLLSDEDVAYVVVKLKEAVEAVKLKKGCHEFYLINCIRKKSCV